MGTIRFYGRVVAHELVGFASGAVVVLYSQTYWTNLSDALSALPTYRPVRPALLQDGVRLGYILAQANTTALNSGTAVFLNGDNRGYVFN